MFFVLCDTCIVIDGIDSVTFFGLGSDEKRVLQISDTTMIAQKFVTKKHIFVKVYIYAPQATNAFSSFEYHKMQNIMKITIFVI